MALSATLWFVIRALAIAFALLVGIAAALGVDGPEREPEDD